MVLVPLPIQFPPVQRSLPIQSTLPKIFKASDCSRQHRRCSSVTGKGNVGGGSGTGGRGRGTDGEREREGGGGGGTGVMEFQKIPYLFSINGDGGYGTSKIPLFIFNKWGRELWNFKKSLINFQ